MDIKTDNSILISISICLFFFIWSCSSDQKPRLHEKEYFETTDKNSMDTLFRVPINEYNLGEKFCYINQNRDTIIPFNKFENSFSDTIIDFGIVMEKFGDEFDLIGINNKGQRIYEIFWFDNGPDYISEGMFRILRNGKIGYADSNGKIIISPKFNCAFPFKDGEAKVTYDCLLEKEFENTIPKSNSWFRIDKSGKKIN
jgi:hypothetical protein